MSPISTVLLEDSHYEVSFAKERFAELRSNLAVFMNSNTITQFVELDRKTGHYLHKIRFEKRLPRTFSRNVVEILSSLRAALDQAGFSIARVHTGRPSKDGHFPFADTADVEFRRGKGRSKDLPPEIFWFMWSFKPYEGGNDLLWALNKMINTYKHEALVRIDIAYQYLRIHEFTSNGLVWEPENRWNSRKNEITYLESIGDYEAHKIHLSYTIAFDKIDVLKGKPAFGVLNQMVSIVESILMGIEAKAARIGLIP